METVFIDGTKLEACANKYTFVWKKSVGKWEEKMFLKIQDAVQMINLTYMKSFQIEKETRTPNPQEIMEFLSHYCKEHKIPFVNGRGKRKSIHQRYYEMFRRFLDHQLLYDLHHSRFEGRNSYSKTDPDATFMHMKDDHMRNGRNGVSNRISANVKTWNTMKQTMNISATAENDSVLFLSGSKKAKVDMYLM